MIEDKKAIIFDFDGTLCDSIGVWNTIDQRILFNLTQQKLPFDYIQNQRERILKEELSASNPYKEYWIRLKDKYQIHLSLDELLAYRLSIAKNCLKHDVHYKENADTLIKALKEQGKALFIASTSKKWTMDIYRYENPNILEKAKLDDYFQEIYTNEDAKKRKPHPEIYEKVLAENHLKAEECLVFEDSLVGVQAAKEAQLPVIGIYDKYSEEDIPEIERLTDYYCYHYSEVLEHL